MLANSYSYLPVLNNQQWYLISDAAVAIYLGAERDSKDESAQGEIERWTPRHQADAAHAGGVRPA
jgi:hypothetical protein